MPPRLCSFSRLPGRYAIVRLAPDASVPASVLDASGFASVTRTTDELSIVCDEALTPAGAKVECGWEVLKLHGPFTFDQIGVLPDIHDLPVLHDGDPVHVSNRG